MPATEDGAGETKNSTTGLTNTQQQAIEKTWAIIYADVGTHGLELFLRLFKQVPHSKGYFEKFKNKSLEELRESRVLKYHATKMMDGVNLLINNLGNGENLVNEIQKLAREHQARSVTSQDFRLAFDILQNLLKVTLSDNYDDVASESWKSCCDVIWSVIDAEMNKT